MIDQLLQPIINTIDTLQPRRLLQVIGGIILITLLIVVLLIVQLNSSVKYYSRQMSRINQAREDASLILGQAEQISRQQEKVEQMLEQDRNFKLKEFVDSVLQELHLTAFVSRQELTANEVSITEQGKYTEWQLVVSLVDINTKQLVECLAKFETNERVYLKKIEITKSPQKPAISTVITIATLTPASEVVGPLTLE